jgi:hypothetical protein
MRRFLLPLAVTVLVARPARASDPVPAPAPKPEPPSALMFDPRFREGKPDDALTKDDAPLRRGALDAFLDLFEAGYDLSLTAEEEQAFRDAVETSWPAWDATAKDALRRRAEERAAIAAALRAGDGAGAKRLLDAFVSEQDARLAAAPTAAYHRPLVSARRRKAETFSAGSPPVSVAAQDAFEEMTLFLLRVARNEDAPATEGQRLALRDETRKAVDKTGDVVRRHYARMPRLWLLVKARWDASDDAGKLRMRWAAVRAFRWLLGIPAPIEERSRPETGDLVAYAAAAKEVAAAKPAFDSFTLAFQNPQALISAAVEGVGMDPGDLEKAFSVDPLTLR